MERFTLVFFGLLPFLFGIGYSIKFSYYERPPLRHKEYTSLVNPAVFLTCFNEICDVDYGCFEPFVYVGYLISLPPISGCPEIHRKRVIRFVALDKKRPDRFQSVEVIKKRSRVAIAVPGTILDYDANFAIMLATSLLTTHDYVVSVDWVYLTNPYEFDHIAIPVINGFLTLTNGLLVGRAICVFAINLIKRRLVDPDEILIAGHSAGASLLSQLSDYCKNRFGIRFGRFIALEHSGIPFRRNPVYHVLNYTQAKVVEALLTTADPPVLILEELVAATAHFGAIEIQAHCVYIVNPEDILVDQPPCKGIITCSHNFMFAVFTAGYTGKCLFRYEPCPDIFGPSSLKTGYTNFHCRGPKWFGRSCIRTSLNPLKSC